MLGMGRGPRIDIDDGCYHVMNRGVARQATFHCDADRVEYGRLLGVGHERFGVEVYAYCLLPNHYHLLLHCPRAGLSAFMHQLGSVYTRHVNDRSGRDGPLFRGRFHSIPITDDRQLLATVRYIHRNALDVSGVTSVADYRWSSHRAYLGHRRSAPWLRTDVVLEHFSGDVGAFADFVETDDAGNREGVLHIDLDVLTASVALVLDEIMGALGNTSQSVTRTVLILIADRLDGAAAQEVVESLRFATPEARAAAVRRARRRASADPALAAVVDRVLELAYTMCLAQRVRGLSA
jgi:REP element-mobilizing transposase RayT